MRRAFGIGLAALLCTAALAKSEPKIAEPPPSGLARSILPPDAYNSLIEKMSDRMIGNVHKMVGKENVGDKRNALKAALREALVYEALLALTSEVYGSHFTKDEIKVIGAFFQTPAGRKYDQLQTILKEEFTTKLGPRSQERLPIALKRHGLSLE
jgi:hypothetical protein